MPRFNYADAAAQREGAHRTVSARCGQRAFERKPPTLGDRAAIDAEPVRLAVGGQHAMTRHQDGKGISARSPGRPHASRRSRRVVWKIRQVLRFSPRGMVRATSQTRRLNGGMPRISRVTSENRWAGCAARRNALDRDFGIQGRGGAPAVFGHAGYWRSIRAGFDIRRFRKLTARIPTRPMRCRIGRSSNRKWCTRAPHYANHSRRDHSTVATAHLENFS